MAIIKFTSTYLSQKGKKGVLKKDSDGYYEIVIGGLNVYNSVGEYYVAEGAVELFNNSSTLMRRIQNGALFGEVGHPQPTPGMSDADYYRRVMTIDKNNQSAHFKEVWLDTEYGKKYPELNNPELVGVVALVKPVGIKAAVLSSEIEEKGCNVAFSVRGITENKFKNGRTERILKEIVTWDQVPEPGISNACKWQSTSLETIVDKIMHKDTLVTIANEKINSPFSTENDRMLAIDVLKTFDIKPQPCNKLYNW